MHDNIWTYFLELVVSSLFGRKKMRGSFRVKIRLATVDTLVWSDSARQDCARNNFCSIFFRISILYGNLGKVSHKSLHSVWI